MASLIVMKQRKPSFSSLCSCVVLLLPESECILIERLSPERRQEKMRASYNHGCDISADADCPTCKGRGYTYSHMKKAG